MWTCGTCKPTLRCHPKIPGAPPTSDEGEGSDVEGSTYPGPRSPATLRARRVTSQPTSAFR